MGLNVFHKFDEKNVITGLPIFHFERKNVKFVITIFCLVKDIDFEKENKLFVSLYYKHILGYHYKRYGQADWELPKEKKTTKPIYSSMYIFTFKKKKIDSYFSMY